MSQSVPEDVLVLERDEWGNFYGFLDEVKQQGSTTEGDAWSQLQQSLERKRNLDGEIEEIEKHEIGAINHGMERLRLRKRGLELDSVTDESKFEGLIAEREALEQKYAGLSAQLAEKYTQINRDQAIMKTIDGTPREIALADIVRAFRPNEMNWFEKCSHYAAKVWEFIADEPREANTEGGVYPAIFGTVLLVLSMSVFVTPFGVIAAIYLREYATQGVLTRIIRIAVNNLAGVPSVVYGVFGLGFFVYFLGGNIDKLFFPGVVAGTHVRHAGTTVVFIDAGNPHRAGGDRIHRGRFNTNTACNPRRQFGLGGNQSRDTLAHGFANGDARDDDGPHSFRGPGRPGKSRR